MYQGTDGSESQDELEAAVTVDLATYAQDDRVVSAETYAKLKKEQDLCVKKLNFKMLPELDRLLEGVTSDELIVISGYTGFGKTLLAQTINYDFMYHGTKTLFISYEVNPLRILPDELDLRESFFFLPLELKTMDVNWLFERIEEAKLKFGVSVVFIDHLHFIVDMLVTSSVSLNIGATMRALKGLAKKLNITIFVLAHTGQPKDGMPSSSDIRDSSFIAQESDITLIVHRITDRDACELTGLSMINKNSLKTYEGGNAAVSIEKARRSGVYKRIVLMQKQGKYLREVEKDKKMESVGS
jgi:replicative DNA helicase